MHLAHLVLVATVQALIAPCMASAGPRLTPPPPLPLIFTIEDIRCNREWDRTSNSYSGKLDDKYPLTSKVSFYGSHYLTREKKEFALERCFNKNEQCARVSHWYPSCGNSCGDANLASIYDGVIRFDYRENGITELNMNYTDAHFEEDMFAAAITFRIMEEDFISGTLYLENLERFGNWSITKRMLDSCRNAEMESQLKSAIVSFREMSNQMQIRQEKLDLLRTRVQARELQIDGINDIHWYHLRRRIASICQSPRKWRSSPCFFFHLYDDESFLMPLNYGCQFSVKSFHKYCWRQEAVGSTKSCWGSVNGNYRKCSSDSDCRSTHMICHED